MIYNIGFGNENFYYNGPENLDLEGLEMDFKEEHPRHTKWSDGFYQIRFIEWLIDTQGLKEIEAVVYIIKGKL